jgi:hypothetical protein
MQLDVLLERWGFEFSSAEEALVGYLQGRQAVDRAGCLDTPTAKGSRSRGAGVGALRSFFRVHSLSFRAGTPAARHARSPVRAAFRPDGASRQMRRWGERQSAAAGRGRELKRPVSCAWRYASRCPVVSSGPRAVMSVPPLLRRRWLNHESQARREGLPRLIGCSAGCR